MKRYSLGIVLLLMLFPGVQPAQGKELAEIGITIVRQTPAIHAETFTRARAQFVAEEPLDLSDSRSFPGKPVSVPDDLKAMISEFPLLESPQGVRASVSKPSSGQTADFWMPLSQSAKGSVVMVIIAIPVRAASGPSAGGESPEYRVLTWTPGVGDTGNQKSRNFRAAGITLVEESAHREPPSSINVLGFRIEHGGICCDAPVE